VPVAVESFDEYRRTFGGFEGPGLLPYAVAAFFDQGGRRAYVARIVHDYGPGSALNLVRVARGDVRWGGTFRLHARSEGAWGNRLRAAFGVTRRPVLFDPGGETPAGFTLASDADVPDASALLVTLPGGTRELRYAQLQGEQLPTAAGSRLRVRFDFPTAAAPEAVEVVEGEVLIDDGRREERFTRLGLSPDHPRWVARAIDAESELVYADPDWVAALDLSQLDLALVARLPVVTPDDPPQFTGGEDGYADIVPDDFFDALWTLGDDEPGEGVHCLVHLSDLSQVCVPDLYSPGPLAPVADVIDPTSLAGPTFAPCVTPVPKAEQAVSPAELAGLRRDPSVPGDLAEILALQQRLEELAETLRSFVVLLDVPPGLNQRRIVRWRSAFGSAFVAAYHPWLAAARPDDSRDALIRVPPSAAAAGVIAATEIARGVPHGPANVLIAGAVDVTDPVSPARHDELHPLGVNVLLRERDGIRLTAARTLSRDPDYRQLSVRRLMTQLRRTLDREMQWAVFEPNNASLRNDVRRMIAGFLGRLFRAGALRGATEDEAFFVRIDESAQRSDTGQLLVEVGVAPAEPLEFLILRLVSDADGITVSEA
jgi:hypothetical protein